MNTNWPCIYRQGHISNVVLSHVLLSILNLVLLCMHVGFTKYWIKMREIVVQKFSVKFAIGVLVKLWYTITWLLLSSCVLGTLGRAKWSSLRYLQQVRVHVFWFSMSTSEKSLVSRYLLGKIVWDLLPKCHTLWIMKVLSRRPKGKFVFLNRCLPWDDLPFVNDKKNEGPNLHEAKIVLIKNF